MARLKLTDENYYSQEANMQYMSASQFKAFNKCEAATLAELRGEWRRESTTALLVGSYVDASFSGELPQFIASHPEIMKKDGTLKAEYINAQAMAERLERDDLARMLLSGGHQVIKAGKINGVWFKAKYDSLLPAKKVETICKAFPDIRDIVPFGGPMIVDLKCMRDFAPIWDEDMGEKVSFIRYWGYDIQGAIYQHLDKRHAPFVIVGVSKETRPDITAQYIPDSELEAALYYVGDLAPRYAAIKRGEVEPTHCGKCDYCREMKKLHGIEKHQ